MIDTLKQYGEVLENASLKKYNTYHIETSCDYIVFPSNKDLFIELIKYIKDNNLKYFILGNGSNIVLSDNHFNGIVIKLDKLNKIQLDDEVVVAESGVMLPRLANLTIDNNLSGLEWATAIPGTIGGSVKGNAGAYKECIFDYITNIEVLTEDLEVKNLSKDDVKYSYRHTSFKDNNDIILSVTLKLKFGNKEESMEVVKRRAGKRRDTQPLEYPSAGSVFRNPDDDAAGRIIEQEARLKGYTIGGAQVSEKHANFIINIGNATGSDIRALIKEVHDEVLEKTNIDLVLEQEIVDWN